MYLKSDRELYRRRRRLPWLRLLFMLVLIGGGAYGAYTMLLNAESPIVTVMTPTPEPTATPSPAIYVAEAEDAYWSGDAPAGTERPQLYTPSPWFDMD